MAQDAEAAYLVVTTTVHQSLFFFSFSAAVVALAGIEVVIAVAHTTMIVAVAVHKKAIASRLKYLTFQRVPITGTLCTLRFILFFYTY